MVSYPARHDARRPALDPRQFTWLPDRRTALTVISEGWEGTDRATVSVLRVGDERPVTGELVEVEYGVGGRRRAAGARCPTAGWCWSPATT